MQLIQQYVQKSRTVSFLFRSASVMGREVLSQSRPAGNSGALEVPLYCSGAMATPFREAVAILDTPPTTLSNFTGECIALALLIGRGGKYSTCLALFGNLRRYVKAPD